MAGSSLKEAVALARMLPFKRKAVTDAKDDLLRVQQELIGASFALERTA